jgi:opacity protein-like surface antigen
MKNIFTAAVVATLFAGAAAAETQLGNGFSLETEVKAERKVDAETSIVTISPEVTYNVGTVAGLELTAGTTLSVWDNTDSFTIDDEFDHLPVLEFGADYAIRDDLSLEASTSYDLEAEERGEITVSLTFAF